MKLKKNQLKKNIKKKIMLTFETGDSSHEPWTNSIETEKKKIRVNAQTLRSWTHDRDNPIEKKGKNKGRKTNFK
jgi:hypothetical protein